MQKAEVELLLGKSADSAQDGISSQLVAYLIDGDFVKVITACGRLDLLAEGSKAPSARLSSLDRLSLAIACLHAFVQASWTGPDLEGIGQLGDSRTGRDRESVLALGVDGCEIYHLTPFCSLLLEARNILEDLVDEDSLKSAQWWLARALTFQQKLLDDPSETLSLAIFRCYDSLAPFLEASHHSELRARFLLERGLAFHVYHYDQKAKTCFEEAGSLHGLRWSLSGALGRKTKFQTFDTSQLLLLAQSAPLQRENALATGKDSHAKADGAFPVTRQLDDDVLLENTTFANELNRSATDDPSRSSFEPEAGNQTVLEPLDQCILLALCLNVSNTNPSHGLTIEEMTAYVSRVLENPRNWIVHTMALLLRSRLEKNKSRTVERSAFQLQALVDQMKLKARSADGEVTATGDAETGASIPERFLFIHAVLLPSRWEMEKELAERFVSIGAIKSALEIYERLQMWQDAVECYRLIQRPEKGVAMVRALLGIPPGQAKTDQDTERLNHLKPANDDFADRSESAKLWCLLGDLEDDRRIEHYQKAWSVSNGRSSRAQRSLGGVYYSQGQYELATEAFEKALKLNPLFERIWFILGCATMRTGHWEEGIKAFTRCVQLDPENGEAWNNLASVYLSMAAEAKAVPEGDCLQNPEDETLPLSDTSKLDLRYQAFLALSQGLRHKYDSWRIWSNYALVAIDVGETSEAVRALERCAEIKAGTSRSAANKRFEEGDVDMDIVERVVSAVVRVPFEDGPGAGADDVGKETSSLLGHGLLPRANHLLIKVLLPLIPDSPRLHRCIAKLALWQGHYKAALEAELASYRLLLRSLDDPDSHSAGFGTLETSPDRMRLACTATVDMVQVLENLGERSGLTEKEWKFQARGLIKSLSGRLRANFEDSPEYESLQGVLLTMR